MSLREECLIAGHIECFGCDKILSKNQWENHKCTFDKYMEIRHPVDPIYGLYDPQGLGPFYRSEWKLKDAAREKCLF